MPQTVYDITPPITPQLAVFPGDTKPQREVLLEMDRGDHIRLSTLRSTVHVGAHVDAPSHYGIDGATMEQQPLELFIGPAQVIHVDVQRGGVVTAKHVKQKITEQRILLRTNTFPDPEQWNDDFAALDPAFVDWLHERGVRLVGVDTPSVDSATTKVLAAHHRFLANDMQILEGIVLRDVPEGVYELIALPLRLVGFDASPVRAVLRTLPSEASRAL